MVEYAPYADYRSQPDTQIYSGLWYPVVITVVTLVIGMLFVKETKDVSIR